MKNQQKLISFFLVLATLFTYYWVAYKIERTDFISLMSLYYCLFGFSFLLLKRHASHWFFLVGISVLFRLVFLVATPNLSQDFYRFIWDGRMILEGYNPYIHLPITFMETGIHPVKQAQELFNGMGSFNGSHFTNYPPVNQLGFLLAAFFSNTSILGAIIVLRLQIILADIGILYVGKKLLDTLNLPRHSIFLYVLNPLIIIELTGNLHFEPVMLFFLVVSFYLLFQKKWIWAAVVFGVSVSVKLIPLFLIPILFQWFTKYPSLTYKKSTIQWGVFSCIVLITNVLLFTPFLSSELLSSYTNSIGLWFRSFEFNGSLYYIAREIGYLFRGYNEIAIIGKLMGFIAVMGLICISFLRKNKSPQQIITAMLLGLTMYYFTTTTVHPWYLASLVLLSVFTKYRFTIIWSFVIIFSYHMYANTPWKENLWWIAIEYGIVYGVFIAEILGKKIIQIPRYSDDLC